MFLFFLVAHHSIAPLRYIPERNLWINPDCGLKTRGWKEVNESLTNMVAVAKELRNAKAQRASA